MSITGQIWLGLRYHMHDLSATEIHYFDGEESFDPTLDMTATGIGSGIDLSNCS